ncbi:MAG: hypothetical protein R3D30_10015 [Hyphomicrobiales bacterium]
MHRFERFAKRIATERDYSAWPAARAIGEAALRTNKTDVAGLRAYVLSPDFTVAGFKGEDSPSAPGTISFASQC